MATAKTAIVLFTRLPQDEDKLLSDLAPKSSTGLFQRLITHIARTATQVAEADFLFSIATDNPQPSQQGFFAQRGRSFAERLANVFYDAYEAGYERVIVIGNDCAELTAVDLSAAVRALDTHDCVLGPAEDGGLYLIGLKRVLPDFLSEVRWQQGSDCAELAERLQRYLRSVHRLEPRLEIDTLDDMRRFAARHRRGTEYEKLVAFMDACLASHRARRQGIAAEDAPFIAAVEEERSNWQIPPPVVHV